MKLLLLVMIRITLQSRFVIPAYEPKSTKNEATNSNHVGIYHRFRLKTYRNDGAELGIFMNRIIV